MTLPPPLPTISLPTVPAPESLRQEGPTTTANTAPALVQAQTGKSPRRALWWSLAGPIAGLSTCAATIGTLVYLNSTSAAPQQMFLGASCVAVPLLSVNAGHVYAGETRRAAQRTLRRVFWVFAPTAAGFFAGYTRIATDRFGEFASIGTGAAGLAVGLGTSTILAIREIIDAPKAARRYNQKHSLSEPSPADAPRETQPNPPAEITQAPQPDLSTQHPALRIYPGF
jgi:hypothetical protein